MSSYIILICSVVRESGIKTVLAPPLTVKPVVTLLSVSDDMSTVLASMSMSASPVTVCPCRARQRPMEGNGGEKSRPAGRLFVEYPASVGKETR